MKLCTINMYSNIFKIVFFVSVLSFNGQSQIKIYYSQNPSVYQSGMGGAGYSLMSDEGSVALNPAFLGIAENRFRVVSLRYSIEYDYDDYISTHSLRNNLMAVSNVSPRFGGFYTSFWIHSLIEGNNSSLMNEGALHLPGAGQKYNSSLTSVKIGYGHKLGRFHSIGSTINWMHSNQDHFGTPIRFNHLMGDIGYLGNLNGICNVACVIDNLKLLSEHYQHPLEFAYLTLSVSKDSVFNNLTKGKLRGVIECVYRKILFDNIKSNFCVGLGVIISNKVSLRSGISVTDDYFQVTFGAGLTLKRHFAIDYYLSPLALYPNFSNGVAITGFNLFQK